MSELDARVREMLSALRTVPVVQPAARARLRAALDRERIGRPSAPARRGRHVLTLSPLRAVLAAAFLVLATSATWYTALEMAGTGNGETHLAAAPVQFVLIAAEAHRVSLVGDFNDWDPQATPLTPGDGGVWSVVLPLARGRFSYSYVVDEREWRADPNAPPDADDFGRPTSVLYVAGPETAP